MLELVFARQRYCRGNSRYVWLTATQKICEPDFIRETPTENDAEFVWANSYLRGCLPLAAGILYKQGPAESAGRSPHALSTMWLP